MKNALEKLSQNSLVEIMEGLETLLVYTKNLIMHPDDKKYRKVKTTNIHYVERLGRLAGAADAMNAIGYAPSGEYLRVDEKKINEAGNGETLRKMEKLIQDKLNEVKKQFSQLPVRIDAAHLFSSVSGAGSFSSIGKRHTMDDDEIIIDGFCGDSKQGYFAVYDGHGGRATVDFVVKVLHMNLEQQFKTNPNLPVRQAYHSSYLSTDGQLRRQNILRSGSTSVTCLVRVDSQTGTRTLFTANVGDSRAILCRGGKAQRLTVDHKASLPEEAKRITDAGGFIGRNKRVNGVLAISRALGDHMLKENDVVTAIPHCTDTPLNEDDTYLLLACDGLWDVMTDQEAIDFMLTKIKSLTQQSDEEAKNAPPSTEDPKVVKQRRLNEILLAACKALVREALERRSLDNVTAMIVKL